MHCIAELCFVLWQEEEEPVDITDRFYQFRFPVKVKEEKTLFNVREEVSEAGDGLFNSYVPASVFGTVCSIFVAC